MRPEHASNLQVAARLLDPWSVEPFVKVIPMLKSYTVSFRVSPTERLSAQALDEVKGLDNALTQPSISFGQDIRMWLFRTGRAKAFLAIFSWHAVGATKSKLPTCLAEGPCAFAWLVQFFYGPGGGKRRPVIAGYVFVLIDRLASIGDLT